MNIDEIEMTCPECENTQYEWDVDPDQAVLWSCDDCGEANKSIVKVLIKVDTLTVKGIEECIINTEK